MKFDLRHDPLAMGAIYALAGGFLGIFAGVAFLYLISGLASVWPGADLRRTGVVGSDTVWFAMTVGSIVGSFIGGMAGIQKSR